MEFCNFFLFVMFVVLTVDQFVERGDGPFELQKLKFNCRTKFSNLSSEEWLALKNLSKRHDIVIKSADKGGAVVVWRSDLYKEEASR